MTWQEHLAAVWRWLTEGADKEAMDKLQDFLEPPEQIRMTGKGRWSRDDEMALFLSN